VCDAKDVGRLVGSGLVASSAAVRMVDRPSSGIYQDALFGIAGVGLDWMLVAESVARPALHHERERGGRAGRRAAESR